MHRSLDHFCQRITQLKQSYNINSLPCPCLPITLPMEGTLSIFSAKHNVLWREHSGVSFNVDIFISIAVPFKTLIVLYLLYLSSLFS